MIVTFDRNRLAVLVIVLAVLAAGCASKATSLDKASDAPLRKMDTDSNPGVEGLSSDIASGLQQSGSGGEERSATTASKPEHSLADGAKYSGALIAGSETTPYLEFNADDYQQALKQNKKILLNFYANWCNICKAQQFHYIAAFREINDADFIGFRVNFKDSGTDKAEEELAKEFGISYQHTMVLIKDGKRVFKSPEALEKARIVEEVKKI